MKRFLFCILILSVSVFTAGCNRDRTPKITDAIIKVSDDLTKIRFHEGIDRFDLQFEANYKWHIEVEGDAFSVTPTSGDAGTAIAAVQLTKRQTVDKITELGKFTIVVDNSDAAYTVRVVRLPKAPDGGKTIIAYFFGRDLSYYFSINVNMMKRAVAAGALDNGGSLILFRQTSSQQAEIQELYFDEDSDSCESITLETIEFTEDLTAESFGEYFKKAMDYAPAANYSAIFLGHSKAWLPKNPIQSTISTYGFSPKFVPSFDKAPGALVTRDIGEKNVQLDMDELAEGIASTGVKFNALYFDVCFMSSLEAAYELRNTADFIIASPCEIMGEGSPYNRILQPLFDDDYETVCEEFYNFYESYSVPSGCIATIDCSKLEAVAEAAKRINATPAAEDFDLTAIQSYEGRTSSGHWFYDAEEYFSHICTDEGLVKAFRSSLDECLPYRYHTAEFYSAYNNRFNSIDHFSGITVTPDEKCIEASEKSVHREMLEYYNPSLRQTAWYKATH